MKVLSSLLLRQVLRRKATVHQAIKFLTSVGLILMHGSIIGHAQLYLQFQSQLSLLAHALHRRKHAP